MSTSVMETAIVYNSKYVYILYIGRRPGKAEGQAGCGHSKIARVRAYYLYCMWLALLTSV